MASGIKTLEEIFYKTVEKTKMFIPGHVYSFSQKNSQGILKNYSIKPEEFSKSLKNKYGDFKSFSKIFTDHLEGQKNIIAAFASTPISFSDAWNMKTEILSVDDVVALTKSGGHFQFNQIPNGMYNSGSGLYQNNYARGLVQSFGTGITKGFRHKTGGVYEEDSLNEMGIFTYATPNIASGMMEYRFSEQFSLELGVPLIYIITQWFKYETKFEKLNNWLYMTGVAKVVGNGKHPHDPIKLQLISKDEALKLLNNLIEAFQTKGDFRIRPPMPEHLKLGWSYDKIKADKIKRQLIITYASKHNLRCPGDKCGNMSFRDLKNSDVHIGHRISQKWNSQNYGVVDVHHPYNLYLSCYSCNISLGEKYPVEIDQIINKNGTIGDWLMNDFI
jgi:hypothetical protein